jgi:hypothetical protein
MAPRPPPRGGAALRGWTSGIEDRKASRPMGRGGPRPHCARRYISRVMTLRPAPRAPAAAARRRVRCAWIVSVSLLAACADGPTTSGDARVEFTAPDAVVLGDSALFQARVVRSDGGVDAAAVVTVRSSDSTTLHALGTGAMRARNVGTVTLTASADGATPVSRTVRVTTITGMRLQLAAPDTINVGVDQPVDADVLTPSGTRVAQVGQLSVVDAQLGRVVRAAAGGFVLTALRPGTTELRLAIGSDTIRRAITVRRVPIAAMRLQVIDRVLAIGDSLPTLVEVIDSTGLRYVPVDVTLTVEPIGRIELRNGWIVARQAGLATVQARLAALTVSDTVIAQAPSAFQFELVNSTITTRMPARVMEAMAKVTRRVQQVIRSAPPGGRVSVARGECGNRTEINELVVGARVHVVLDDLPGSTLGRGGPCVLRDGVGGLPLVGVVVIDSSIVGRIDDRKLYDLLLHESLHVLGIGSLWRTPTFGAHVVADSLTADPLHTGPNTLRGWSRTLPYALGYRGRAVPVEVRFLAHWRNVPLRQDIMAASLMSAPQTLSAITVGALKDLGWDVETEAYEDLPDAIPFGRTVPWPAEPHEHDVLPSRYVLTADGRMVRTRP